MYILNCLISPFDHLGFFGQQVAPNTKPLWLVSSALNPAVAQFKGGSQVCFTRRSQLADECFRSGWSEFMSCWRSLLLYANRRLSSQGPSVLLPGSSQSAQPRKHQRLSGKLLSNEPEMDFQESEEEEEAESH